MPRYIVIDDTKVVDTAAETIIAETTDGNITYGDGLTAYAYTIVEALNAQENGR